MLKNKKKKGKKFINIHVYYSLAIFFRKFFQRNISYVYSDFFFDRISMRILFKHSNGCLNLNFKNNFTLLISGYNSYFLQLSL